MRRLGGVEEYCAKMWLEEAAGVAMNSACLWSKCGSVVVKLPIILGGGLNSSPGDLESQRRCLCDKAGLHPKVTDKTCCMHAEERAIIEAIGFYPRKNIKGANIYFARIDDNGNIKKSGKPYCTICSKLAPDVGISRFILWHENGIYIYSIEEYNLLLFSYGK